VPKIKIQIEASDDDFEIEDIELFLQEMQDDFLEDGASEGHKPWTVSIINKNGTLTPVESSKGNVEEDEDDDDDEWDDEHTDYDEEDYDDDDDDDDE
jgi:hypothetical protein